MKKKAVLLPVLTALFACAVGGGALAVQGQAEDAKPVVGAFTSWDGHTFNGTSSDAGTNRTVISYQWSAAGTYLTRVNVSGYTETSNIELSMTSDADATIRLVLFSANGWNVYGSDAIATTTMTANTAFTQTIDLSEYTEAFDGADTFDMGFYFDSGVVTDVKKNITVNTLTVGGVSYQPAEYTSSDTVEAPDGMFKEYTEWDAVNGVVTANTLESMPDTDERYTSAVSEGRGNFSVSDVSAASVLEIPLSETLTAWPTDWTTLYVKFKANNLEQVNAYIEANVEDNAFCFGLLGAWNCTVANSVSEGYKIATVNLSTYFVDYLKNNDSVSKIVFEPVVKNGAASAGIEIAGMSFGNSVPVFINDVGTPEIEIGDWSNQDGTYTIEQEGSLTVGEGTSAVQYKGLKISYTKEQASLYANICAGISNFDAAKYPMLRIGFYTDSDVKLGIYGDWSDLQGHTAYGAGYHVVTLDMSQKNYASGAFILRFYLDSGEAAEFDGTKTVVFDCIRFHKSVEVVTEDASADGLFDVAINEGKISWTYDAAQAGVFYTVSVPVENWNSFDRYLIVNVTLDSDTQFGVYYNAGSLFEHVLLGAGTYNLCLDTAYGFGMEWFKENGNNAIKFYCDVSNKADASQIKTVTINSLSFGDTYFKTSPDANVASIDYAEEKITFGEAYEVSTDAEFTDKLTSGQTIVPGSELYVREKNGASAVTTFVIAERPVITADNAPQATVGESFIRFGTSGYEYKFGADGEWVQLGSWGNLEVNTEYTIYIRLVATEKSFASEAYEMKIKTSGSGVSSSDSGTSSSGGGTSSSSNGGCGSVTALGSLVGAILLIGGALIFKKREGQKRDE